MLKFIKIFINRRTLRHIYELFHIDKYSKPAQFGIDDILQKYMPYKNGYFIEVGANDGYSQSNTYYLERFKEWRGLLIEGIPDLYEKCKKERKNSTVLNCALVSNDFKEKKITMYYSNLMSIVKGARNNEKEDKAWIVESGTSQEIETNEIEVEARTLNSILEEYKIKEIDLFSLDVEGYELQVLQGLDIARYAPKFILVEANLRQEVCDCLFLNNYKIVEEFPVNTLLFKKCNNFF